MKVIKFNLLLLSLAVLWVFIGCQNSSEPDLTSFLDILIEEGYTLEAADQDSRDYFTERLSVWYDLDAEILEYHSGTITTSDSGRWARIIQFKTSAQAEEFCTAASAEDEYVLFYREGSIVVETYSTETHALFE